MPRKTLPVILLLLAAARLVATPALEDRYAHSLVVTPLYVEYTTSSEAEFSRQAAELKQSLGTPDNVLVGFAANLHLGFPASDLHVPITRMQMVSTLEAIDLIVRRARANGIVTHISILSGFFHGNNELRQKAIVEDVRNAQWFADGWIADPQSLSPEKPLPASVWATPSRYAVDLRARIEEAARIVGAEFGSQMAAHPEALVSVSGDGEVELSYERSPLQADYGPFMVAEFRDWVRESRYKGDRSPASDDNGDGKTFNQDFHQSVATWQLKYFESSGPIPLREYLQLQSRLPSKGPYFIANGFDAPRAQIEGDDFWSLWTKFRQTVVANYEQDFASWITGAADPATGSGIPAARFYSHQIPADYLFGETNGVRLQTSASPLATADISPAGSVGITAFNTFNGTRHAKTTTARLFSALLGNGRNWGIVEYNPSMPAGKATAASSDAQYYDDELQALLAFHPHLLVPFAWTTSSENQAFSIHGTAFERALRKMLDGIANTRQDSY